MKNNPNSKLAARIQRRYPCIAYLGVDPVLPKYFKVVMEKHGHLFYHFSPSESVSYVLKDSAPDLVFIENQSLTSVLLEELLQLEKKQLAKSLWYLLDFTKDLSSGPPFKRSIVWSGTVPSFETYRELFQSVSTE